MAETVDRIGCEWSRRGCVSSDDLSVSDLNIGVNRRLRSVWLEPQVSRADSSILWRGCCELWSSLVM